MSAMMIADNRPSSELGPIIHRQWPSAKHRPFTVHGHAERCRTLQNALIIAGQQITLLVPNGERRLSCLFGKCKSHQPTARFSPPQTLTLSLISLWVHLGTNAIRKCSRLSIKMHDSACGGDPWQSMEMRRI